MAQHTFGDIQGNAFTLWVRLGQCTAEITGATAHVQPALWLQALGQALEQLATHGPLQLGDTVVAGGRTGKGRRYLAFVGQAAGQRRLSKISHHRTHAKKPG
ncbi:hypothetical protein D3C76_1246190 [compost metagenome]